MNGKTFQDNVYSVSLARPRKQFNRNSSYNNAGFDRNANSNRGASSNDHGGGGGGGGGSGDSNSRENSSGGYSRTPSSSAGQYKIAFKVTICKNKIFKVFALFCFS